VTSERHAPAVAAENACDVVETIMQAHDIEPVDRARLYAALSLAERVGQLAEAVERFASAYEANT
jgi:hypothetical protein